MADSLTPRVVLGVAAHADDLDYCMAGTAAAWAAAGCEVYYLVLTNGNKGTADQAADPQELAQTRQLEQRRAAALLGVKDVFFGGYEDGLLEASMDVKCTVSRYIRRLRPDVVVTFDPSMLYYAPYQFINHPDHRAAGQAALDAVYPLARDHLSFPSLCSDEGLQPHKVATLLLINFAAADYVVDISATIDKKLAALAAHTSQGADRERTQQLVRSRAAAIGQTAGVAYAESFVRIVTEE